MRWLCGFGAALVLVFLAAEVDARGRGGRGGGRGGFSRSGPAAHGSFRTRGGPSFSRPSTRPSFGGRPSSGPSTQPARPSRPRAEPADRARPGDRQQRDRERPDREGDREENREDWQDHREEMQDDRQEYAKKAREDWQEYAEWDEHGHYWVGGWYGPVVYDDDDTEWVTFVAGIAVGTALTSGAYQSMKQETQCTPQEVVVDGVTYLKCGNHWYNRVMQGGSVNYVVVAPPPGF